jgi:hypothetical protein
MSLSLKELQLLPKRTHVAELLPKRTSSLSCCWNT